MMRLIIAVTFFYCLASLCSDAAPLNSQLLPERPGYIPVYIRYGNTPLHDINPVLAEAFGETINENDHPAIESPNNKQNKENDMLLISDLEKEDLVKTENIEKSTKQKRSADTSESDSSSEEEIKTENEAEPNEKQNEDKETAKHKRSVSNEDSSVSKETNSGEESSTGQ